MAGRKAACSKGPALWTAWWLEQSAHEWADGVLCSEEYEDEQSPEKIIELYAECIRLFHSIDISDCPYTNSLDSRLAELDYLLNNDLADVDCENWEEDTPFKDPRELYDF